MPTPSRREALARILADLRSPDEGLLPTDAYATLLEAFMASRDAQGRDFDEDEFYGVVEWADLAALRSQWLSGLVEGHMGIDLVDGEPVLTNPPAGHWREAGVARLDSADVETDVAITRALGAFIGGRLAGEASVNTDEIACIRAWCQTAAADRALLDLALGYPVLGIDLVDGRLLVAAAGRNP